MICRRGGSDFSGWCDLEISNISYKERYPQYNLDYLYFNVFSP